MKAKKNHWTVFASMKLAWLTGSLATSLNANVISVTNLFYNGAGSLRDAINQAK